MARRERVPRHKSSRRKRNKNPKLSPFQLEQKRARLANQAPTPKTMGTDEDIPHSQRGVFEYLQAKRARLEKRRQERQQLEDEEKQGTKAPKQCSKETLQEGREAETGDNEDNNVEIRGSSESLGDQKSAKGSRRTRSQEDACIDSPSLKKRKKDSMATSMSSDQNVSDLNNTPSPNGETETDSIGTGGNLQKTEQRQKKKTRTENSSSAVSLNQEFLASVGNPIKTQRSRHPRTTDPEDNDQPRTVEEIIARKKEKKHRKKAEARRQRVAEQIQKMEEELSRLATKKSRKRSSHENSDFNLAFEKKLKELQKEKSKAAKSSNDGANPTSKKGQAKKRKTLTADVDHNDDSDLTSIGKPHEAGNNCDTNPVHDTNGTDSSERKRISFDDSVVGFTASPPAVTRRPRDFFELIDIPKFGERVEAPPVFEVVPNKDAAVTRLARRLEGTRPLREGRPVRGPAQYRFVADREGGGLGEEKRLARLGLAPAITHRIDNTNAGDRVLPHPGRPNAGEDPKKKEMEALRDYVMATYRQNRRNNFLQKKGVDMSYAFPKFSG